MNCSFITFFLDHVDSTNRYAKNHIKDFDLEGLTMIYAGYQTDGYGTFGRKWISKPGENLLTSFCFPLFASGPFIVSMFCEILQEFLTSFGITAKHKDPNDLIVNQSKIAGILAEPLSEMNMMVLGVGLNVNLENTNQIDQPVTSIFLETNQTYDIHLIAKMFGHLVCKKLAEMKVGHIGDNFN